MPPLTFRTLFNNAAPFFIIIFGGAMALVPFSKIRHKYKSHYNPVDDEVAAEYGYKVKTKAEQDRELEEIYNKIQKMDIDNWQNIRGPRPWEDNTEFLAIIKEKKLKEKEAQEVET